MGVQQLVVMKVSYINDIRGKLQGFQKT